MTATVTPAKPRSAAMMVGSSAIGEEPGGEGG